MGLSKWIFNKILGWEIQGTFDKDIKKSVIIVVPHTSWHDFFVGVFVRRITKIEIHFIAKKELFKWPFGWYFRWMGGVSLDRTSGQNKVEAIAKIFEEKEVFRLSLSPEGTRKKVTTWKTGYYYIARNRKVIVHKEFYPTGNIVEDTKILHAKFKGVLGKKSEYSFTAEE